MDFSRGSTRFAHLFVVSLHACFIIICTQEDDLELLLQLRPWTFLHGESLSLSKLLHALVPLRQLLGEFAAWRTPVGTEVEAQMLPFLAIFSTPLLDSTPVLTKLSNPFACIPHANHCEGSIASAPTVSSPRKKLPVICSCVRRQHYSYYSYYIESRLEA